MKKLLHTDKSNIYYPIIIILLFCLWLASCNEGQPPYAHTVKGEDSCDYVLYEEKIRAQTYVVNYGITDTYTTTTKMLHSATCKNPNHNK